jgi:Replication protein
MTALPLDRDANNLAPPPGRSGKASPRTRRYARRTLLWDVSTLERVRKCGRVRRDADVRVRGSEGGAVGFAGLCSCGSVWACPVCNAKIMARRSRELSAAITSWQAMGGRIALVTLTLRHSTADPLDACWSVLSGAWQRTVNGRVWRKWRDRLGSPGYVRAVEVTHGRNGWHVHVHLLLFLRDVQVLTEFEDWLIPKWVRSVEALGFAAPTGDGQDIRLLSGCSDPALGDYLTKATDTLGLELTHSQSKVARRANATVPPWQLLTDVLDDGDADALDLWTEWEVGSKGRRQLNWSRGLRELLGLNAEKSDEDIAAETVGDEDLVLIPGEEWDGHILRRPHLIPKILDAAERGPAQLRRFLIREGIAFAEVDS